MFAATLRRAARGATTPRQRRHLSVFDWWRENVIKPIHGTKVKLPDVMGIPAHQSRDGVRTQSHDGWRSGPRRRRRRSTARRRSRGRARFMVWARGLSGADRDAAAGRDVDIPRADASAAAASTRPPAGTCSSSTRGPSSSAATTSCSGPSAGRTRPSATAARSCGIAATRRRRARTRRRRRCNGRWTRSSGGRRGGNVDSPWGRVAATPWPGRG